MFVLIRCAPVLALLLVVGACGEDELADGDSGEFQLDVRDALAAAPPLEYRARFVEAIEDAEPEGTYHREGASVCARFGDVVMRDGQPLIGIGLYSSDHTVIPSLRFGLFRYPVHVPVEWFRSSDGLQDPLWKHEVELLTYTSSATVDLHHEGVPMHGAMGGLLPLPSEAGRFMCVMRVMVNQISVEIEATKRLQP